MEVPSTGTAPIELRLLDGGAVTVGSRQLAQDSCARLAALLALAGPCGRARTAGMLWPEVDPVRASGNLRSTVWRLRSDIPGLLGPGRERLALSTAVVTDIGWVLAWGDRLVAGAARPDDLALRSEPARALHLLPGWYDDWLTRHRERVRQQMLLALDCLIPLLLCAHRYSDAVEAALIAVGAEPTRESARLGLIRAHLAEGNEAEALLSFRQYDQLLTREFGTGASPVLANLVPHHHGQLR
jgi:DNA-binding SARP family transcriptional activator